MRYKPDAKNIVSDAISRLVNRAISKNNGVFDFHANIVPDLRDYELYVTAYHFYMIDLAEKEKREIIIKYLENSR